MNTFAEIIGLWKSLRQFADDIDVPYVTAQMMHFRDSINPEHWDRVVEAAEKRGFDQVTLELLQRLYKARKAKGRARGNGASVAA